jgi:hypothetical protein
MRGKKKNPFRRGEEQFDSLYGERAEGVRRLIDAACEAEELFGLDDLERFAEEERRRRDGE